MQYFWLAYEGKCSTAGRIVLPPKILKITFCQNKPVCYLHCYITACKISYRNVLFHHVPVVTGSFCTLFPYHPYHNVHNGHSVLIYLVCH